MLLIFIGAYSPEFALSLGGDIEFGLLCNIGIVKDYGILGDKTQMLSAL